MPEHDHAHQHSSHAPSDADTNEAIWKSDIGVTFWKSTAQDRERRRSGHRVLMAEMLPFGAQESFAFIDLGAGTGAAARTVMDHFPRARAILADYSGPMMAQGKVELEPYAGRYEYVEFNLAHGGEWPAGIPARVEAVISSMAIHHLNDARKLELFGEIRDRLVPGGWFLNYDPVTTSDPVVQDAWHRVADRRDPSAAGQRQHRSPEEQLRWENHTRYMIALDPQVAYLREAGFEGVDVYWKELDYAIYGGRRPV
jgi:ubiquinone/menaquinone biosynthesis C-methylase UbiE